jgi:hypothetical protein
MSAFTVELDNHPGELARLCEAMAGSGGHSYGQQRACWLRAVGTSMLTVHLPPGCGRLPSQVVGQGLGDMPVVPELRFAP